MRTKFQMHLNTYTLLLLLVFGAHAGGSTDAFPEADDGMTRYLLQLPAEADESGLRVELIIGRTVRTDSVNRYFFAGRIEEKIVEGWGFTRYVVEQLGPMAGTLMAAVPGSQDVERFITLGGEPYLIRYNSRLPIVVYVPEGAEIRYRIWRAGSETRIMEQG